MALPGSRWHLRAVNNTRRQRWHCLPAIALQFESSRLRGQAPALPHRDVSLCPACPFSQHSAGTGSWRHEDVGGRTRRLYPSSLAHTQAGYPGVGTGWLCQLHCPLCGQRVTSHGVRALCCWQRGPCQDLADFDARCWCQAVKSSLRILPRNTKRLLSTRSFPESLCDGFRPRFRGLFSLSPAVPTQRAILKAFCLLLDTGKGC